MDFTRQNSHPITLLSGPPSCGKTSLLFQFAFNSTISDLNHSSAGNDPTVVFICNRRRLESKPPFLSQGIDSSSDSFQRIQMKYVDDDDGIKKYFSAFHLFDKFPVAVVIDDFGDFFNDSEKSPCKLLISDTHYGDSPRLLFIYKRWVSSIFTIKGDGKGSFLLSRNNNSGSEYSEKTRTAKYSIALQYLVFEGIIEDDKN
ncbi:uncharacterized protein [Euphorbia lathyris]|uniref:uncharacterized protein isoform X2 n=1 Tax=Euphorbia lathyris TaxID=212925 RepID=UPI0033131D6A